MKAQSSILSSASGSLGGSTFRTVNGKIVVQKKSSPIERSEPFRLLVPDGFMWLQSKPRNAYIAAVTRHWSKLTDTQRAAINAVAPSGLSGFNWYVKKCYYYYVAGTAFPNSLNGDVTTATYAISSVFFDGKQIILDMVYSSLLHRSSSCYWRFSNQYSVPLSRKPKMFYAASFTMPSLPDVVAIDMEEFFNIYQVNDPQWQYFDIVCFDSSSRLMSIIEVGWYQIIGEQ